MKSGKYLLVAIASLQLVFGIACGIYSFRFASVHEATQQDLEKADAKQRSLEERISAETNVLTLRQDALEAWKVAATESRYSIAFIGELRDLTLWVFLILTATAILALIGVLLLPSAAKPAAGALAVHEKTSA